ncbi:MAG: hypothetical protein GY757_52075, partial [bacterium]|nr:hypothetical protein [bacterium]
MKKQSIITVSVFILVFFLNPLFMEGGLRFFWQAQTKYYAHIPGYRGKVQGDIHNAYNDVWKKFDQEGKDKLPACVAEAFEKLRGQQVNIIYMTEGASKSPRGLYKRRTRNITVLNTYNSSSCDIESLIFHEMLHKALHDMEEKEKDEDAKDRKFCVRIITEYEKDCDDGSTVTDYECTNKDNFASDEAMVEDCELNLYPCGLKNYQDDSWQDRFKDNGARSFNPPDQEDCPKSGENICKKEGKECDDKCPKDEKCPKEEAGGDVTDDNFSFSSGVLSDYRMAPNTLILARGFYKEAEKLFGGLQFDGVNSPQKLLRVSNIMIIPTGALFHSENDATLKHTISEYVRLGGTVIVFAQQ